LRDPREGETRACDVHLGEARRKSYELRHLHFERHWSLHVYRTHIKMLNGGRRTKHLLSSHLEELVDADNLLTHLFSGGATLSFGGVDAQPSRKVKHRAWLG
jgi:hypothetical protein